MGSTKAGGRAGASQHVRLLALQPCADEVPKWGNVFWERRRLQGEALSSSIPTELEVGDDAGEVPTTTTRPSLPPLAFAGTDIGVLSMVYSEGIWARGGCARLVEPSPAKLYPAHAPSSCFGHFVGNPISRPDLEPEGGSEDCSSFFLGLSIRFREISGSPRDGCLHESLVADGEPSGASGAVRD